MLATLSLLLLSAQALTPEPEILERLQKAVDQGGYDSGLQLLKTMVEREPANLAARFFLATAYQAKQNYPACLETISGQSKYDDRAIGIWWVCLDESGQQEQALALAQKWLKEFPQSAELHRWHGVSLSRQWKERSAEARHEFRTALQLDPHDTTALYMLAQHFRSAGLIVPSLFTYLRFLVEEPAGRRADKARDQLRMLLSSNLVTTPTDKGPTEIRLSLGESSSQEEGNLSAAQQALTVWVAPNNQSPELTPAKLEKALRETLRHMDTSAHATFTDQQLRPYIAAAFTKGVGAALCQLALNPPAQVKGFEPLRRWHDEYSWAKP